MVPTLSKPSFKAGSHKVRIKSWGYLLREVIHFLIHNTGKIMLQDYASFQIHMQCFNQAVREH